MSFAALSVLFGIARDPGDERDPVSPAEKPARGTPLSPSARRRHRQG